jgi:S1-C subfamily serine protease
MLVPASSGSGFAVSSDGHIITNYHVIQGCQRVKIHFNGKSIPITLLAFDPRNDLALLAGNFRPTIVLPLSTSSPKLLQDVYVAGFPFGRNISTGVKVTKGIITSLMGAGNNFVNIQIDAALQPGNSGGPILDDKGNVVGVAVSILDKQKTLKKFGSSSENSNFGIKVLLVKSMLEVNNISSPAPNKTPISRSELGKIIYSGTYYLSCWMTTEQIKKTRSKKLEFQNAK